MAPDATHVIALSNFTDEWLARLRAIAPSLRLHVYDMFAAVPDVPDDLWRMADVLFTFRAFPQPRQAPRLRWIQLNSAGADRALAEPVCRDPRVTVTNLSGIHAVPIAEHVFTVLLACRHRVPRLLGWQADGVWPREHEVRDALGFDELFGQVIGIVGYGSIGRQVARIAHAFGMRVLALQRRPDPRDKGYVVPSTGDPEGTLPERFFGPAELHELLAASDVVVLALPSTPTTRHIVDAAALRAMKPSGFLINVGRGSAIDEAALAVALREGWIGGAALDVVENEPPPPDHVFWRMPNLFLTPHISGISPRYEERAAALFAENLQRYVAGVPLLNVVDPERGY